MGDNEELEKIEDEVLEGIEENDEEESLIEDEKEMNSIKVWEDEMKDASKRMFPIQPANAVKRIRKPHVVPKKPIPKPATYAMIKKIYTELPDDYRGKKLFLLLYATGGRVSEVLNIRPRDIVFDIDPDFGKYISFSILTEKNRSVANPMRTVFLYEKLEPWYYTAVRTGLEKYGNDELILGFLNRKTAYHWIRKINFGSTEMIRFKPNGSKEIIIDRNMRGYPHYLRHCRLTHLKQKFHFDEYDLMDYAGWSSVVPGKNYVRTNRESQRRAWFGSVPLGLQNEESQEGEEEKQKVGLPKDKNSLYPSNQEDMISETV